MDGRKDFLLYLGAAGLAFASLLAACSGSAQSPAPASTSTFSPPGPAATLVLTSATFADPFAYCAAAGTVDKPDARYTGTPVPDEIIAGYKQAAGLQSSTEPLDVFRKTTIWRCMGGQVFVCNFGANLPCDSKANSDKTPSPAMNDYCNANPNADFLPMSVTGHETIYSWRCVNGAAEILSQVDQVDPQGYLQRIWYPIQPGR